MTDQVEEKLSQSELLQMTTQVLIKRDLIIAQQHGVGHLLLQ